MQKNWVYENEADQKIIDKLSSTLNINYKLATLLAQRNISGYEEAKNFFRPSPDLLHDPFLMKDMPLAIDRLSKAIAGNEKILIYGDYDVDGTTAVSLMVSFLRYYHKQIDFYIPDRSKEGYGISKTGIKWASDNHFSLIISLDCGIRAIENISLAKQLGIDFIVCDHHTPGDQLPQAIAILDPKRDDCDYPYKELTGCGIGFKLLQAFCDKGNHNLNELYQYLDYVVISIAADIVPITGENRTLSYLGLNVLRKTKKPGLKSLMEISGVDSNIDISKVVFGLAPRINAAGRINHARDSVNLLLSDEKQANTFAIKLNKLNQERKNFDKSATEEAISMIDKNPALIKAKTTLLHNPHWHKGVIGIVASRCIEKYHRPTIICTTSENKITGSARSVPGFDIYDAILNCEEFLEQFGGHKYAAGLTLSENQFENFKDKFESTVSARITSEQLTPQIKIDTSLDFNYITYKFYNVLKQMGPFGPGNSTPIFVTRKITATSNGRLMKESHIKIFVKQSGFSNKFEAIGFNLGNHFERIQNGETFNMAYSIQEANYKDSQYLQLNIRDIKFSEDNKDAA